MSTLCFFCTVVFFIPGDVAPEAQTRCEKMGAVGTVVWFTIYAQTDSSAWGFKKGLRWLGPPFGEITCVFFWLSLKFHPYVGVIEIVRIAQGWCSSFFLQMRDAIDFVFFSDLDARLAFLSHFGDPFAPSLS